MNASYPSHPRAAGGLVLALLAVVALSSPGGQAGGAAPATEPPPRPAAPPPESPAGRDLREGRGLDPNTASASDLELLPGIGPATAARIVADREERGPYPTLESLDRVRGIGPRTVERLRPMLRIDGAPGGRRQ